MLPPLMFSEDEIEALVLGSRWVSERGDGALGEAARNALAKIAAVLARDLKEADVDALLIVPGKEIAAGDADSPPSARAIRAERKLRIPYCGRRGATGRMIWPFALALFRALARGRRLVRDAPGLPPLPHRPHRGAEPTTALSAPPRKRC